VETIKLAYPAVSGDYPAACAALGFFDGVHRGHRDVIETAVRIAEKDNLTPAVMTFYPHPKEVLRGTPAEYLTTLEEKKQLLQDLGVKILYLIQFDENFASLSPQEFVDEFIINLNIRHVVAGFDYSYGHKGKGSMEAFRFHSRNQVEATTVAKFAENEVKISSTAVREALKMGDVEKAALYLGRFYKASGKVITGEKRGRTIGFPTANVEPPPKLLLPAPGVYTVAAEIEGQRFPGVANLGYKPTFHENDQSQTLEVHLFDFDSDIYGKEIQVEFHAHIRDEKRFNSVEELINQINKDAETARNYFQDK
jgi:riboflavin kinase / FMN adenylyltransferase